MEIRDQKLTIGAVVAELPEAAGVFSKYGIDFCCGGHRNLFKIMEEQGLDRQMVLGELQELKEARKLNYQKVEFTQMSAGALTDYIEDTHHSYLRRALPELADLLATILRVHGQNHRELFEVYKVFGTLKTELEQHLLKEENMLFPDMEAEAKDMESIQALAREIIEEHEGAGELLQKLRELTGNYSIPEGVCDTFRRTYEKLEELEQDLHQHIHLENNILLKEYDHRAK
jgi:regulator of cell morphogenesis and NO signaling